MNDNYVSIGKVSLCFAKYPFAPTFAIRMVRLNKMRKKNINFDT